MDQRFQTRGVTIDTRILVISRATGANQTAFTGLQPLIPDTTTGNPPVTVFQSSYC